MRTPHGFTLVELIAALALVAVLAALGAPAFRALLADARRTAAVNALVRTVHGARVAALTRGVEVVVCPSADGAQCSGGREWARGFISFANRDRDQPPRVDRGEPVLQVTGPSAGTSIRANRASFVLRPPGRRSVNGTFVVCDARGLPAARVVVVSPSGRPRTAPAAEAPGPVSCSA